MPSRPHLQNLSAQIADLGGEDWVFDQIAAAEPMKDIAGHFTNPETNQPYSRQMVYAWIHAGGPERERKWEDAKEVAAHIYAEQAGEVLDESRAITSAEASLVKARSEYRKWLAQKFNRKTYGDDKAGVDINLNIGQLHLDALRAANGAPALPARAVHALPAGDAGK